MSNTQTISKPKTEEKISICDVMKTNSSKIIQKIEAQIPSQFQQYSDLYAAYLHTLDDVYGTCFISEKEFFDNLHIDQGVLHAIQEYSKSFTDTYLDQIDLYSKYRQEIVKMQMSSLKVYDNNMHNMMDVYAKTLSYFNHLPSSK